MRQIRLDAVMGRVRTWTSPVLRTAMRQAGLAAMAALCANAVMVGRWHPFGMAMALVMLRLGVHPLLVLAGAASGRLMAGDGWQAVWGAGALSILCLGSWAGQRRKAPVWLPYALFIGGWVFSFLLSGLHTPYDALMGVMEIAASMLALWVFRGAQSAAAQPGRVMTEQERVLCVVTAGILVLGLGGLCIGPVQLIWAGAGLLALLCAQFGGAGAGAAAGLGMGAMIALSAQPQLWAVVSLAMCAVAAGALRTLKRVGMALIFLTAAALMALLKGEAEAAFVLPDAIGAVAVFMLMPQRLMEYLRLRFAGVPEEERGALHVKQALCGRLEAFGAALKAMGDAFSRVDDPQGDPKVEQLLAKVCQRCCGDCTLRSACWQHDYEHTAKALGRALVEARGRGRVRRADIPPEFARRCLRVDKLCAAMGDTLYALSLSEMGRQWLEEDRKMLCEQLGGMAALVDEVGAQLDMTLRTDAHRARAVRAALEREGIRVQDVQVHAEEDGMQLDLTLQRCRDCTRCDRLPEIVGAALGRKMERISRCPSAREKTCYATYMEGGALCVQSAVANRPLAGGISGDSTRLCTLGGTRRMAALSDGMGAGARAAQESEAVLEMVARFYEAGFGRDITLKAINQIMRLRSGTDMFATLDMLLLDVKLQAAEIIKVGAAPSLHISAGRAEVLAAEAPPIGILDQVKPAVLRRRIQPGDVFILASDGVTDRLGSHFAEVGLMIAQSQSDPQRMADALLHTALQLPGEPDDMTVLAVCLKQSDSDQCAPPGA